MLSKRIQIFLSTTAAVSVLFFLTHALFSSSTIGVGEVFFMMLLAGVALSPILVWLILSLFIKSLVGRYVFSFLAAAAFVYGGFVYYDELVVQGGAMSILILLFFPIYQDGAFVLLFGVLYCLERLGHRRYTV